MADINQFQRSRDRIIELLHNLTHKKADDPETLSYIRSLEMALKTLESKMEEYHLNLTKPADTGLFDLSF